MYFIKVNCNNGYLSMLKIYKKGFYATGNTSFVSNIIFEPEAE